MFTFMLLFVLYIISSSSYSTSVIEININPTTYPPVSDVACVARYIVHNSDWCSLSYISHQNDTRGLPLSRVFSLSDGLPNNSTGVPYFMVSPMDLTVQDLEITNNCSLIMSMVESDFCRNNSYDPQDPRCAQVVLTGKFVSIRNNTKEFETAKEALWKKHPSMKWWYHFVPGHKWMFKKLQIEYIYVVDTFGGRKYPSVESYFNATSCLQYSMDKLRYSLVQINS